MTNSNNNLKNVSILCFVLSLTGCLTPKIDLGLSKPSQPTEIKYTQQKLDVKYDEAKIRECKLQTTNEKEIDGGMWFSKEDYVKLAKNINSMRACYNEMREKYLLEIQHYNNLVDIINGKYSKSQSDLEVK